jgi:hypothetical protein
MTTLSRRLPRERIIHWVDPFSTTRTSARTRTLHLGLRKRAYRRERQRTPFLYLEIDMIKFPTILTLRSKFRAGAGPAVAATATPLLTPPRPRRRTPVKPTRNP